MQIILARSNPAFFIAFVGVAKIFAAIFNIVAALFAAALPIPQLHLRAALTALAAQTAPAVPPARPYA